MPFTPSASWSETTPVQPDLPSSERWRNLKRDLRERMAQEHRAYASEAGQANLWKHSKEAGRINYGSHDDRVAIAAADRVAGMLFFETDTGIAVYYNGSAWTAVSTPYGLSTAMVGDLDEGDVCPWMIVMSDVRLTSARATVKHPSDSGNIYIDVEYSTSNGASWSSIMHADHRIAIDEDEYDSNKHSSAPQYSSSTGVTITAGRLIRIYVDVNGSHAEDLSVALEGHTVAS